MSVTSNSDLQFIETPGGNMGAAVATRGRGAVEVSVIQQRQAAAGRNPEHTHDREEVVFVLAGEIELHVAGDPIVLGAGDSAIIPPRAPHWIANRGEHPAEWLLIAPAGVGFFHADGQKADPPWAH